MVPEYSSSWTQEILFSHLHVPVTQRGGGGGWYSGFQVAALTEGFLGV